MPLVVCTIILWQEGVPEASLLALMRWMQFAIVGYSDGGEGKSRPKSGEVTMLEQRYMPNHYTNINAATKKDKEYKR